jgi:hypothetical protein
VVSADRPENEGVAFKLGKGQNFVVQKALRRAEQFWTNASDPLNGFRALLNSCLTCRQFSLGRLAGWE